MCVRVNLLVTTFDLFYFVGGAEEGKREAGGGGGGGREAGRVTSVPGCGSYGSGAAVASWAIHKIIQN